MASIDVENIKRLSVAERILIVEEIWDSIAASANELPITRKQKGEIDIRLLAYEDEPNSGDSWANVKKRIVSKK